MPTKETNPRFTVIIPTKDRARYLYHTLRTCAVQDYDNFEVIVSDDGSADDTRQVVEEASRKDPRIRFVSPGSNVGMLDNFEFALDQAKPGYVLALGGDDGLMPHGIRRMREVLGETGQEIACWPAPIYFYPKSRLERPQLVIRIKGGKPYSGTRIISSRTFLERQAKELSYVGDVESPMFYVKGVASTELVSRVRSRSKDGRFYSCSTPDGYSGIVLAGEVETYAFSGEPCSIFGICPSSAGFAYLSENDQAKKQSEAFFKLASDRPLHADLGSQPYSPLISIMTADYLLTARDLPGWPGIRPTIDYRSLLVKGLSEIQDGLFAKSRLTRELSILFGIAQHHGLGDFFRARVKSANRNTREPLEGNALSPRSIYIDATPHGINDVFDAAYFAHWVHSMSASFTAGSLWKTVTNSARYRMLSAKKAEGFPAESEWMKAAPGAVAP